MRFLKRSDDPPPMRIRRRRRLQRRALYGASAMLVLTASAAGAWYVERDGRLGIMMAQAQTRIAAAGADLHLTVASVQIDGRERADRQAILDALGITRGMPILAVDLDAAKARLETVPWIRSASIERLLPDTIYLHVTERKPLALWQHAGKFDLVDQDGNLIANADPAAFPSLPQVVGDGAPAATPDLLAVLATEPTLQQHATAAIRVGARRWNIELDNGIEVALPETGAVAAWHRLAALDRSDHLLARDLQAIDMRLPDRLVLRVTPEIAKSLIKKSKQPQASPNT
ncbi:MAG TPA: cell division protein FtsQ/DivIB [Stellaceae bacterium]|jgi:cell division protein FtsQ|nr:cell division protein FtsQ/DivIB [Stellaceae bacterium]